MKQIIKSMIPVLFVVFPVMILSNCHATRKTTTENAPSVKGRIENFDKFYDRFHNDSVFQVSRTRFPLGGMSVEGFNRAKWTKDNLPLMRTRVYDIDTAKYKVSIKRTETTFTQKVWLEDSGFSFECRFELIHNKWYLVYVLDENL